MEIKYQNIIAPLTTSQYYSKEYLLEINLSRGY